MVVSAAAIDTDMDLIGLMSEPGVATAGSGRQNNHEPQVRERWWGGTLVHRCSGSREVKVDYRLKGRGLNLPPDPRIA